MQHVQACWAKMKKCWYYDPTMTLEENKKATDLKNKEKPAAKKEKAKEAEKKLEVAQRKCRQCL